MAPPRISFTASSGAISCLTMISRSIAVRAAFSETSKKRAVPFCDRPSRLISLLYRSAGMASMVLRFMALQCSDMPYGGKGSLALSHRLQAAAGDQPDEFAGQGLDVAVARGVRRRAAVRVTDPHQRAVPRGVAAPVRDVDQAGLEFVDRSFADFHDSSRSSIGSAAFIVSIQILRSAAAVSYWPRL